MTRRLLVLLVLAAAAVSAPAAGAATLQPSVFGPSQAPGAVAAPNGVTVDDDGLVYVADTGHDRVVVLHPDGTYGGQWAATDALGNSRPGTGPGQFMGPKATTFDGMHDTIWVADTGNNRIQQLSPSGTPLTTDGGPAPSVALGAFNAPRGIATDVPGDVFVADTGNNRIQRRDALTGAWSLVRGAQSPVTLAVGADGALYFNDGTKILRLAPGSSTPATLDQSTLPGGPLKAPAGLAINGAQLYVTDADASSSRLLRYDTGSATWTAIGVAGTDPGAFNEPEGVAFGQAADRIYVADSGNDRVQRLLDPAGPPSRTLSTGLAGTGAGTITSDSFGLGCPGWCAASFAAGTRVRLVAAPVSGSSFSGWSGACTGTASCVLTLRDARRVNASFTLLPSAIARPKAIGSADRTRPRITRVSVSPKAFHAPKNAAAGGRRGGKLHLTLSERATLRIDLVRYAVGRRVGKRCVAPLRVKKAKGKARKKAKKVRTCTRRVAVNLARSIAVVRGKNTITITGRVHNRSLAAGRYTAALTPTDVADNRGLVVRATFTVLR